jgi:hypothetical protein
MPADGQSKELRTTMHRLWWMPANEQLRFHNVRKSWAPITVIYYHNKQGGLMVKVFVSNPKVKGSNLMGGVVGGQLLYFHQIFF